MMKRMVSILLVFCMIFSMVPVSAYAAEADGLCEHHPGHTADCGYGAAVAGADCAHVHDGTCGWAQAVEEVLCACETLDENGALVHAEGCGYVAPVTGADCTHSHDAVCGYVEAAEGSACTYVCQESHGEEPDQEPSEKPEKEIYPGCAHHNHDDVCGGITNACSFVCGTCVAEIQAMVNALPDMENITNESKPSVAQALSAIDARKHLLSDAGVAAIDFDRYADAAFAMNTPENFFGFCVVKRYEASAASMPQASFAFLDDSGEAATVITAEGAAVTSVSPVPNGEAVRGYLPVGTYTLEESVAGQWNLTLSVNGQTDSDHTFTGESGRAYSLMAANTWYGYSIAIEPENGDVTVTVDGEEAEVAAPGREVTLTLTPNDGYVLQELTVSCWYYDEVVETTHQENGTYTFLMPRDDVTVTAVFKPCDHTGGTATCTQKAVCENCGESYGEADPDAHTYVGEETQTPTCDASGEMTYTCADCGDAYTDDVPAYHDNNLEHHPEKEAIDCAHPGNIEYWYCPGCAEYFADACAEEYINPWYIEITVDCVRPEDAADCAVVPCEVCGADTYGYGEHDVLACQGGTCGKCGDEIEGYGCSNYDTPACGDGLCYYCGGFVAGFGHENNAWAPCCDGKCTYGCGLAYPATEDHVDEDGDEYCDICWNHLNHTLSASADELYCDEQVTCTVCWATLGYGTKHTMGDWQIYDGEQHQRWCIGCNDDSTIEYASHTPSVPVDEVLCNEWVICADCGLDFELGTKHTMDDWVGYDDEQHYRCCYVCGDESTKEYGSHIPSESASDVPCTEFVTCADCEVPLELGTKHTIGDYWTWFDGEQHYRYCTGCGAESTYEYGDHRGGTATCTNHSVCEDCGNIYGDLAHDVHDWSEPAYTVDGDTHTAHYTCNWDANHTKADDPAAHTFENGKCVCSAAVKFEILQQPVDDAAKLGERYCVEVVATGEDLQYQWYFRNAGAKKFAKSGITDSTYDDVMTAARANREVYCVITDASGNTLTTNTVKLLPDAQKLAITRQPEDASAKLGEIYSVTVEAEGDDLKYQWYFKSNGRKSFERSSITTNEYTHEMNQVRHNREVYCLITDGWGNQVVSETVTITAIPETVLAITRQPEDTAVKMGETYSVTVEAEGDDLKYQWYFKSNGRKSFERSSITTNEYTHEMNQVRHNRLVYCVITDRWGNKVTSNTVTIRSTPGEAVKIVEQPKDASVKMGETYCAEVIAEGTGLTYQWYFRNAGQKTFRKSYIQDSTYDDIMNEIRAGRSVYCIVTDIWGNSVRTDTVQLIRAD